MGESPLHAPVLGSSEAEGTQVSPAHPLRVGLECRPPGLSAKAAGLGRPWLEAGQGLDPKLHSLLPQQELEHVAHEFPTGTF